MSFEPDDYVLYRDPVRYWGGQTGHSVVCRVTRVVPFGKEERYHLVTLNHEPIKSVRGGYLRLLPPSDAMRDIDLAPLNNAAFIDEFTSAGAAWLAQQPETDSRPESLPESRPELPQP